MTQKGSEIAALLHFRRLGIILGARAAGFGYRRLATREKLTAEERAAPSAKFEVI